VADEVVGHIAEVIGGDHRTGELLQCVGVGLLDGLDQAVEAHGRGGRKWLRHASALS